MAFRLKRMDLIVSGGFSFTDNFPLNCFDTLDDPEFYMEWDYLLPWRSALEFVREQLSNEQRADLDRIDAHWRENAEDFNRALGLFHYRSQAEKDAAIDGMVIDEDGKTPPIPHDHWWWRPIAA